jgi:oligosaccharyl transferase complex subunit OST4
MISDDDLYTLAIVLGSAAVILIVLYHYLEANIQAEVLSKQVLKEKKSTS